MCWVPQRLHCLKSNNIKTRLKRSFALVSIGLPKWLASYRVSIRQKIISFLTLSCLIHLERLNWWSKAIKRNVTPTRVHNLNIRSTENKTQPVVTHECGPGTQLFSTITIRWWVLLCHSGECLTKLSIFVEISWVGLYQVEACPVET